MERRVRAERGPSARERCGNDWHSPPVFMGRVNQMPIFRDVPEEASNRYGKLLTRLTGHTKTAKNGQNTGFLRLARPSQRRPRTWRWERKRGAALLSFSVCLFRAGILVELGQGAMTALPQLLAEELDVPFDSVDMVMGDTDICPYDMGTFGSMCIRNLGPVVRAAGAEAT